MKAVFVLLIFASALVALSSASSLGDENGAVNNRRPLPEVLVKKKAGVLDYESQGMYHSAYLRLDSIGGFIYHTVYEVGFDLAVGQFAVSKDTLTLEWDSVRTWQAVKDPEFYESLFSWSYPFPLSIEGVKYLQRNDSLIRLEH